MLDLDRVGFLVWPALPDSFQLPPRVDADSDPGVAAGLFPPTMWSAIVGAREGCDNAALQALERLAHAYWQPLYVFARQRGSDHHQAADSVQGFFEHLLSGEVLRRVERRETRFRSFLLAAYKNWMAKQWDRSTAQKRGGTKAHLTLEELDQVQADPGLVSNENPERSFDRRWARTIFDLAVMRLDAELAQKGRPDFLREVRLRLTSAEASNPNWEDLATQFGMNANAVKQSAHALRQRLSILVKEEVRAVVSTEADLAEELRYLVQLLSSDGTST